MSRALALARAVAAACGGPRAAPADRGTVEGLVLLGPLCPVQSADSPCPDRPLAAAVEVRTLEGERVATVRSGRDGRFSVALAPGSSVLQATGLEGIQVSKPVEVTVRAGEVVHLTVPVDTGIR